MDAWITSALAQAGLGIWAVVATIAAVRLLRQYDAVVQQLIAKAETDKRVNTETAESLLALVQDIRKKSRARKPTSANPAVGE